MKATNSTLRQLIEGTKVFSVPLYQRRYSWERRSWASLWDSILEQYDYAQSETVGTIPVTHFIGSFVLAPSPGAASQPTNYILVDGQQRLTTTMVLLAALRDLMMETSLVDADSELIKQKFNTLYLHNAFESNPLTRLRLLPTQQDREDFESCVLQTPATPTGRIGDAYNFFRSTKALRGKDLRGELLDLAQVSEVLLSRLSLVDISTESGDNVHQIFQTLNSAGVKLKQVDLLRNHFFMLLPTRGAVLYATVWRELELRLGETQLDRFFWAELVRFDSRVSRTDVYSAMQRRLEPFARSEELVEDELLRLNADSLSYVAIVEPTGELPDAIEDALGRLRTWGSDTARPLILELLLRYKAGDLNEPDLAQCLLAIESFLVRRMIVGIPTNNLNRIFSSLTPTLARDRVSPESVEAGLAGGQKYWPSDNDIVVAVKHRAFYYSGQPHQRRFVLAEIEGALSGKEVVALPPDLTIEHIMPRTITNVWLNALAHDALTARSLHEQFLHTLGNLTLTGYNSELGNYGWDEKRRILAESSLRINRGLAQVDAWTSESILARADDLAEVIVKRWPGPDGGGDDLRLDEHAAIEDTLLLLTGTSRTSVAALATFASLSEATVSRIVSTLNGQLKARVVPLGDRDANIGGGIMSSDDLNSMQSDGFDE